MTKPLDYARPTTDAPSTAFRVFANLTLGYPLILLSLLYGEWLLCWYMLGHQPEAWVDDPKYVAGAAWMYPLTAVTVFGTVPMFVTAIITNAVFIVRARLHTGSIIARFAVATVAWIGMFIVLRLDPGQVVLWWMD